MSSAAQLVDITSVGSRRLLADVEGFDGHGRDDRKPPVIERLAAVLGSDFAEQIVAALSKEALDRLDAALSPAFAARLAAALAKEHDEAVVAQPQRGLPESAQSASRMAARSPRQRT